MPHDNNAITAAEQAFTQSFVDKMNADVPAPVVASQDNGTSPAAPATPPAEEPAKGTPAPDGAADSDAANPPDTPDSAPAAADDDPDAPASESDAAAELSAFQQALTEQGIDLTLDDLPAEARPLVEKKLKDLEAGFTRKMQQVSAAQKDALAAKADARFAKEHPVDHLVSMLRSDPKLADAVNAKLDELEGSATVREAHDVVVKDKRAKAVQAEEAVVTTADQKARADTIVREATETAAKKAGVPSAFVIDAVQRHVLEHGDITAEELTTITQKKAKAYQDSMRAVRREASKKFVEQKVADRAVAGLKIKPGTGSAPTPAARPTPKNDDEFKADFLARLH